MSATLSDDVRSIKRLMLHNPVIIKLEETSLPDTTQLTQYHIKYVRSKYMYHVSNESLYPYFAFPTDMHYSLICLTTREFIRPES